MNDNKTKYDSLLYGYGLSLAVFDRIKRIGPATKYDRYLDLNFFMREVADSKPHSRLRRKFDNLHDISGREELSLRDTSFSDILDNYNSIREYGFERWVGKEIFNPDNPVTSDVKLASHVLYNYWYDTMDQEVLGSRIAMEVIKKVSGAILNKLNNADKIYTTNFDTLFDQELHPKHIHGRFVMPFTKAKSIVCEDSYFDTSNEDIINSFEYKYLFGTNGFEKAKRLTYLHELKCKSYDYKFLFEESEQYGDLLIYGLSFAKAEFVPDELRKKHNAYLMHLVDGHILMRLSSLVESERINTITFAYYSESDLANYKLICKEAGIEAVASFIHCSDILPI